jgi:hypothetical protein
LPNFLFLERPIKEDNPRYCLPYRKYIYIREATIIYCKSKSKFKRESRRSLEKELQDLSAHRDSLDITDESLDKRINDIEKELGPIKADNLRYCLPYRKYIYQSDY